MKGFVHMISEPISNQTTVFTLLTGSGKRRESSMAVAVRAIETLIHVELSTARKARLILASTVDLQDSLEVADFTKALFIAWPNSPVVIFQEIWSTLPQSREQKAYARQLHGATVGAMEGLPFVYRALASTSTILSSQRSGIPHLQSFSQAFATLISHVLVDAGIPVPDVESGTALHGRMWNAVVDFVGDADLPAFFAQLRKHDQLTFGGTFSEYEKNSPPFAIQLLSMIRGAATKKVSMGQFVRIFDIGLNSTYRQPKPLNNAAHDDDCGGMIADGKCLKCGITPDARSVSLAFFCGRCMLQLNESGRCICGHVHDMAGGEL